MAKKIVKKEKEEVESKGTYFYGVGKRKTAVAQVKVYPSEKASESNFSVNNRNFSDYFQTANLQNVIKAPIVAIGQDGKFVLEIKVVGGGISAQAEAIRLGIARALIKLDSSFRKALKDLGFLTRDSRVVERKKPGLKKARRSPQWAKR